MKNNNYLDIFTSKNKAIHHALWMNFKYRVTKIVFGVMHGPEDNFAVCEQATADEMEISFLEILPEDSSNISYDEIQELKSDVDSPKPWEELNG